MVVLYQFHYPIDFFFFFSSDYILVKNRNSHRHIKLHANKYCRTFGTLKAP